MNITACSVTVDLATTTRSLELFGPKASDCVKQFIGIHPESAAKDDPDEFVRILNENLPSIDGIGEIGLDKTYIERGVPYERQNRVFEAMLSLAERSSKPVSIHSRKSLDDVLQVLKSYRIRGCLLHWFAGSKKQLSAAMDMGLYVSYGPALVYSPDKKSLLQSTRPDRFLIETDGPVRYSRCFSGYLALSTSFLITVANAVSQTLGMTFGDVIATLERNSTAYMSQ